MNDNISFHLKLQAYLDDELSSMEARQIASLLARDEEAKRIYAELKSTRDALRENELSVALPETPEFYWSKIERAIAQVDRLPASARYENAVPWWKRLALPLAGASALAFVLIASLDARKNFQNRAANAAVIESPAPEADAILYRSFSEGMTVVWIQSGK